MRLQPQSSAGILFIIWDDCKRIRNRATVKPSSSLLEKSLFAKILAMFARKTKIVCSMGPAISDDEIAERVILAGMNVARFNFSHGTHEEQLERMERVRRCAQKLGRHVALLLDTKGPEIRTGLANGTVAFSAGDEVLVTVDGRETRKSADGKRLELSVTWKELPQKAFPGLKILVADGLLELEAESVLREENAVLCRAKNAAAIGSRKNVNLIGLHAGLPILGEQDKKDIEFGAAQGVDFVAASFVSFAYEVREVRSFLDSLGSRAKIIAKIENEEGVNNIEEIAEAADGVMVARGDLGVQMPTEQIPLAQKRIIAVCRAAGKVVITATQMLESMIVNPRPTRAELTDVANAIFDGTDAVMLSGETASGAYPVEAVAIMAKIAMTVEDSADFCCKMRSDSLGLPEPEGDISQFMARNAYTTASDARAMAIIAPTKSGHTAQMISKYRPEQSIIAVTPDVTAARQLLLSWGVSPLISGLAGTSDEMIRNAVKAALDAGAVNMFDRVVVAAGIPLSSPIVLNTIRVLLVGNVLARASSGGYSKENSPKAHGGVVFVENADELVGFKTRKKDIILVCKTLTEDFIPLLRVVNGVVSESGCAIPEDILRIVNPDLIWLINAPSVFSVLEEDLAVTIDGESLMIHEGFV